MQPSVADGPGLPFSGIRVLDLSRVLAGPYCCALLAGLGADVIKIERPGSGDENRRWGHLWHDTSLDFLNVNRSKRAITVELSRPEGQEVMRTLAKSADVLVENFVPGTIERFGLGYDDLVALNPRLIYCSISAYGDDGPLRSKPGYDGALQAFSGHMMITGEPESGPVRTGASVIDMSTGFVAYGAIATALFGRETSGRGQRITTSLFATALALMGTHGAVCLNTGREPSRAGSGVSHLAPYAAYRTKDAWLVLGALSDTAWRTLCKTLALDRLVADPRFETMQARLQHRAELDALLTEQLTQKARDDWVAVFEGAGLVCSPVRTLSEALSHPQVSANDLCLSIPARHGELRLVAAPAAYGEWSPEQATAPPDLGEHTDAVLLEAGFSADRIRDLRRDGIV